MMPDFQSRAEALAAADASITQWERLAAMNEKWVAKGSHRPTLVASVNRNLAQARESKVALLALSDEEWQARRAARDAASKQYVARQEAALDALWAGKITHEQFFEKGEEA